MDMQTETQTDVKNRTGRRLLKVALLQISPAGDLQQNQKKGEKAVREAKAMGADIALFPEMWSNGYNIYGRNVEEWAAEAVPADGDFTEHFRRLAEELDMAVGITLLEKWDGGPKNTMILYDRRGTQVMKYSKVHTCAFDVEKYLTPGEDFCVADLDTAAGNVKVGAMICFDREFPESARVLMLRGAELILVPNACPMEINRLCQLRARAFENMVCIATCNYPESVPDCNGHSTVFDGMAFVGDEENRNMCILEAGEKEGIYVAEIDLDELREYREHEVFGKEYRHPEKYRELAERM
ncbi:carbon-nitrogen hydrolase family protein [Lachnoclostridium sp. An169]|mgnify:FL=1|uniref:carbon-nitrogen hydrolase family protein n=1 Tax=Lachnoclostridium sp. An169 TaxID=1965569 RepID=UPI001FA8A58E|nr:carbon-nitrogen hydrolase family protein [Lachnoclostridium sp. An169]